VGGRGPAKLEKQIVESGHSRFPVYDEDMDDIIGVLYLRDYL
jgi:putative hemolysin